MGGSAFTNQSLYTPRMPPSIYHTTKDHLTTLLKTIYSTAQTPLEAPSKPDYGDVDILVLPRPDHPTPCTSTIQTLLGAEYTAHTRGSDTVHFAVPWPDDDSNNNNPDAEPDNKLRRRYIQVDVHTCRSRTALQYTLFTQAHGDFWSILGVVLRPFGFTNNMEGFFIRVPGLEGKAGRVLLSQEPDVVLRYLGLEVGRYWGRFASVREMLAYIATCRFYDPVVLGLKSHDREKVGKRGIFRVWVEEWVPRHRGDGRGTEAGLGREEVVEDMKCFFGGKVAEWFDEVRRVKGREVGELKLWSEVRKGMGCDGSDLTFAMKGLKFEVMAEDALVGDEELSRARQAYKEGDFDVVKKWAGDNWEAVKERQQQRDREKCTAKLLVHLENEKRRGNKATETYRRLNAGSDEL